MKAAIAARVSRGRYVALLFASLAIACASAAISSCTSVIGADENAESAIARMCKCQELAFLGDTDSCNTRLSSRLSQAVSGTQAAWLQKYADDCTTCPKVLDCYYSIPTCSDADCTRSQECCNFRDGGVCGDNQCK